MHRGMQADRQRDICRIEYLICAQTLSQPLPAAEEQIGPLPQTQRAAQLQRQGGSVTTTATAATTAAIVAALLSSECRVQCLAQAVEVEQTEVRKTVSLGDVAAFFDGEHLQLADDGYRRQVVPADLQKKIERER